MIWYRTDFPCEEVSDYRPGSYHPLGLGEFLHNGRYKILHKLGWGSFATVWAARDSILKRNVAIKVVMADFSQTDRELKALRLCTASSSEDPDSQFVLHYIDDFSICGPNGAHTCLVTELLGPSLPQAIEQHYDLRGLPSETAKRVAHEALRGLAFLHRIGIGHGDLSVYNLAFSAPDLTYSSEQELIEILGPPKVSEVRREDGKELGPGVPRHVVEPYALTLKEWTCCRPIKIIDFGGSFTADDKPETVNTPVCLRAPELIFDDVWDSRIDLWSMGCIIFELIAGQPPIDSHPIRTRADVAADMIGMVGELPPEWEEKWQTLKSKRAFQYTNLPLEQLLHELYFADSMTYHFDQDSISSCARMLRRLFQLEPVKRDSAASVLEDPWFHNTRDLIPLQEPAPPQRSITQTILAKIFA